MTAKIIPLPKYTEIETHSPIGEKLGGIVELDLKVRIPKNYLYAIAEAIEAGYMTDADVSHALNYELLLGMALEFDSLELNYEDDERVKELMARWNIVYDMQDGKRIESIIENREMKA
jgi:hypothetical protein